jgi:hypothetical protein
MKLSKTLTRATARLLVICFASISCFVPMAQAGMVGTDQVMASEQAQSDRAQLNALLTRADLAEQLQAAGVDPSQLQARIDNLSDEEVATLVDQFEQLPAGSGILGTAVFIFVVLLVTDILGYTNVFPFVKKTVN